MASNTTSGSGKDRHWAQWLALAIGVAYTLVGIAGFFVTGFDEWVNPDGELLLGFGVNPLHNLVHLAIGLAGLAMWGNRQTARGYGLILAIAYLPTFLYGLFVANSDTQANFLALNWADNGLHLVSAIAGLAIAWALGEKTSTSSQRRGASHSPGA